ncbi:MAG: ATP-dependent RecD-like DNA helicase, partial [Polyangiales bacterium]
MGSKESEEVLEGVVEDVLFRSDDGRFAVIRLGPDEDGDLAPSQTAVGDLGQIAPGEHLRLIGRWSQHAVYGARFRVSSFTPTIPSTEKGVIRYLGSGL